MSAASVSQEAMDKARAMFKEQEPPKAPEDGNKARLDVGAYLDHHGRAYTVKTTAAGTRYILSDGCLFDQGHKDAGPFQAADGQLSYGCFHNSCQRHTWAEARKIISGDKSLAPFIKGGQKRAEEKCEDKPIDPMAFLKTGAQLQKIEVNIEWLVPGILPARSLTTFTGRAGIGKTTLLLDMADAMSKGGIFLGRQTIKIPVYYVDFENPLPVVVDRTRNLNITDVYFWLQGSASPPPRIDSDDYGIYKQLPSGLLIFDSLRASQSGDENSSKDMALAMQRYKELRDCGHAVTLIHHTQKANEQSFRGSMAILDLADHVLSFFPVRKPGSDTPIEGDDLDAMTFYLGTKEKTRFSPVKLYVCRAGGRFELARHPDDERIAAIADVLSGQEFTKTAFLEAVKKQCDFGKELAERLLKVGESRGIWECFPQQKNNALCIRLREVGGFGLPP